MKKYAVIVLLAVLIAAILFPSLILADTPAIEQSTIAGYYLMGALKPGITQTFTPQTTVNSNKLELNLQQYGTATADLHVRISLANGSHHYNGSALYTMTLLKTSYVGAGWYAFNFAPYTFLSGQEYAIYLYDSSDAYNSWEWADSGSNNYAYGQASWWDGDSTYTDLTEDMAFRIYPTMSVTATPTPTTPGSLLAIKVNNPTAINENGATFRVSLTTMGSDTSASTYFQFGLDGSTWNEQALQTGVSAPTNWDVSLTGLTLNTKYYYRAKAVGNAHTVFSQTGTFKTSDPSKSGIVGPISDWFNSSGLGDGAWWLVFIVFNVVIWWKLHKVVWVAGLLTAVSLGAMIVFGLVPVWVLVFAALAVGIFIYNRVFRPGSE